MLALRAARDARPAVALVDVTQHLARFSEALSTLPCRTRCTAIPAPPGWRARASVTLRRSLRLSRLPHDLREPEFRYRHRTARWTGRSLAAVSTIFALVQRFYDIQPGRILINGQDAAGDGRAWRGHRGGAAGHPLFHRTLIENIHYARPEAPDEEAGRPRRHRAASSSIAAPGSGHAG